MGLLRNRSMFLTMAAVLVLVCAHANAQGNDLFSAAEKGDLSQVRTLIAAGANVNAKDGDGVTALMYASKNG